MPFYMRIKCPRCRNKFTKVYYSNRPKKVTCPWCGYVIDLTKYPQLILLEFETEHL